MKNTFSNLFLAIFLAFISQGIQAQFDDIYYDPDRIESSNKIDRQPAPHDLDESNNSNNLYSNSNEADYGFDDEYTDWNDQDYYYTSRIKRFHRPYRGFDYYHGCYVDNYFYDPFEFDPWNYDRDIYMSSYGYNDYYRWRSWNHRPWNSFTYWNHWDWCMGWSSYPLTYSYSYWSNNCHSGYNNNYYGYNNYNNNYYNNNHYGRGNNYWNNNNNNNSSNDTYYGSRKFGLTNTSKRGPVRVISPSPKVFTEATGTTLKPTPERGTPRRIVRTADGDVYDPGPVTKPDKTRTKEFPGAGSNFPEKERVQPRYTPKVLPEDRSTPNRPEPRKEYKPERIEQTDRMDPKESEFKPNRIHRDGRSFERDEAAPRIEMQKEKRIESYQAPKESKPQPRIERREENNTNSKSRSDSSGPKSSNSGSGSNNKPGDQRRSPR